MFSRALAKSDEQARAGNLPRLLHDERNFRRFSVASRTTGGQVWLVDVVSDQPLTCDCERGSGWCWHRTHVERALAGEIGLFLVPASAPADRRAAPTPPDFYGTFDDEFEPDPSDLDIEWPVEP